MGDAANEKSTVKSWFKGLKSEYKKIIWPDKKSVGKQTVAVVLITVVLGAFIALFDALIKFGIGAIL